MYIVKGNTCPGPQPNSLGWDLGQDGKLWNGKNGRGSKLSHSTDEICACICMYVHLHVCACMYVHLHVCACGSAQCGCVVNGSVAMAAV